MKAHVSEGAIVKAHVVEGAVVGAQVSEGAVVKHTFLSTNCLRYCSESIRFEGATVRAHVSEHTLLRVL